MSIFNHEDFEIETQLETSRDDLIYGTYVEWDFFRQQQRENILVSYDLTLPWGEKFTDSDLSSILNELLIKLELGEESVSYLEFDEYLQNNSFPEEDSEEYIAMTDKLFDLIGVPSGTQYEKELPDDLQYWGAMNQLDPYEYYLYQLSNRSFEEIIWDLEKRFMEEHDPLIKKAFLLTALITTEAYVKKAIASTYSDGKIPEEVEKKARSMTKLINLFNKVFNQSVPDTYWNGLRNSLAHNIESPYFSDDRIYYNIYNPERPYIDYLKLFGDLISFSKKIDEITHPKLF